MTAFRDYLLGIIMLSLICGIVTSLLKESASEKLIRLACGAVMTVTILAPLGKGYISEIPPFTVPDKTASGQISEDALMMAEEYRRELISGELETYIQNIAAEKGIEITAEITLSREELPVPVAVTIYGQVSESGRKQLQHILQRDLGIRKEDQRWSG